MSFIATAPASTPSTPADAQTVTNDGFFPNINLADLREIVRLDGTVTIARLRNAAIAAVISVNTELQDWKAAQLAAGVIRVDQMGPQIGGISVPASHYLNAVYRTAKADLSGRYRDFDSTPEGQAKADHLETTIGGDLQAARWAIRDLLGQPRTTVDLI